MKSFQITCFVLSICICLCVMQAHAEQETNSKHPFFDLIDNKKEGFVVGGSISYGRTHYSLSYSYDNEFAEEDEDILAELGGMSAFSQWKLGYAFREDIIVYITSLTTHLRPSLGVLKYLQSTPRFYLNAVVGYSSLVLDFHDLSDIYAYQVQEHIGSRRWNIGVGAGYEFRPHLNIEFNCEYNRFIILDTDMFSYDTTNNEESAYFNRITLLVSLNYLFY